MNNFKNRIYPLEVGRLFRSRAPSSFFVPDMEGTYIEIRKRKGRAST
jgi:hypothetical protein